jgi:hypothetical protein
LKKGDRFPGSVSQGVVFKEGDTTADTGDYATDGIKLALNNQV